MLKEWNRVQWKIKLPHFIILQTMKASRSWCVENYYAVYIKYKEESIHYTNLRLKPGFSALTLDNQVQHEIKPHKM